jgi:LysM repeat protein
VELLEAHPVLAVFRSSRLLGALTILGVTSSLAVSSVEIAPGDTLSEIASEHAVSIAELAEWNDIADPDLIYAGDTLIIATSGEDSPTYVVRAGDTLSAVARRFGSTIARLVDVNQLADPDHIEIGQLLDLSARSKTAARDPETAGEPDSDEVGTYTVAAGDTLIRIARLNGLRTTDLMQANDLSDPDRIYVGQTLTIPTLADRGERPSTPTTTTVPTTTTAVPTTSSLPPPPPPPSTTAAAPRSEPSPGSGTGLVGFFDQWSAAYGVDRGLLEALLWKQSGWQADWVGPGGHLGIGQLSPAAVEFVEQRLLGVDLDPLDASDGIRLAARYLRFLIDRTDDERTALAAWTQGLDSVTEGGISEAGGAFADEVLAIRSRRT